MLLFQPRQMDCKGIKTCRQSDRDRAVRTIMYRFHARTITSVIDPVLHVDVGRGNSHYYTGPVSKQCRVQPRWGKKPRRREETADGEDAWRNNKLRNKNKSLTSRETQYPAPEFQSLPHTKAVISLKYELVSSHPTNRSFDQVCDEPVRRKLVPVRPKDPQTTVAGTLCLAIQTLLHGV